MSATDDSRPLASLSDAEAYVALICFKHGPPERIGVELEWTTHRTEWPALPLSPDTLASALGDHAPATLSPECGHLPLGKGSLVTVEPGGQVELSSRPSTSLTSLVHDMNQDIAALDGLLASVGLSRGESGIDPHRRPTRILDVPRYAAMSAFFEKVGPAGAAMMCSTASTQVCLDAGEASDVATRWQALHSIGPALVALFANSPVVAGVDTGWASNRLRATLDTCPPFTHAVPGDDPVESWVATAMTAPVLCVRRSGSCWDAPQPMSFADWVRGAHDVAPTYDDLDYHLSTLFPPVRPRGYVEVRYLDAQPTARWHHPLVLVAALMSSPAAVDEAVDISEPTADLWFTAAREGLRDEGLRATAEALVALAGTQLDALRLPREMAEDLMDTLERRSAPARRRLSV